MGAPINIPKPITPPKAIDPTRSLLEGLRKSETDRRLRQRTGRQRTLQFDDGPARGVSGRQAGSSLLLGG